LPGSLEVSARDGDLRRVQCCFPSRVTVFFDRLADISAVHHPRVTLDVHAGGALDLLRVGNGTELEPDDFVPLSLEGSVDEVPDPTAAGA